MRSIVSVSSGPVRASALWRGLPVAVVLLAGVAISAQVITIDTHGNPKEGTGATVDHRFQQIQPTQVALSSRPMDPRTRTDLIRLMQAEQGFAMRPFPRGHKGLTLAANGKLEPAGEAYLSMVTSEGLCAKPGDRLVITDIQFDKSKVILMLNGGPDAKHRFLRHIQLGTGGMSNPIVQDNPDDQPQGARLTLTFKNQVPEMTDKELKALLSPLISFDVKTPIQAFTDTLPPKLKEAILNHRVMVGMTTDMVLFALGAPQSKIREQEGQMPFEEWIYGAPPQPVQFVRINGNRVIRVEIAEVGKTPVIYNQDEVTGLLRTDGTPLAPANTHVKTVAMGDTVRDPDTQAPNAPPTLRNAGETLPQDQDKDKQQLGTMRPVQFPTQKTDDYPDASRLPRTASKDDDDAEAANPATAQSASQPADQTDKKSTKPDSKPAPPATPPAQAPPAQAPPASP